MVLWEITLGAAYFLGLKRTYRLALKIQRKLISPKHPKTRDFAHRRTRNVFDVVLRVHHNIQQRDIEVGRNVGNWILRWLDKMKPSAQIRGPPPQLTGGNSNMNITKQGSTTPQLKSPGSTPTYRNQESDRHLFTATRNAWSRPLPTISIIMRPPKPVGPTTQYRRFCSLGPGISGPNSKFGASGIEGVVRKDILQYIRQN